MAAKFLEFWRINSVPIHFMVGSTWIAISYGTYSFLSRTKYNPAVLYKGKNPVEVDPATVTLLQDATEDMQTKLLSQIYSKKGRVFQPPFVTVNSEVESIGSLKFNFGGAIGVPYHWRYATSQDIDTVNISLHSKDNTILQKWIKAFDSFVMGQPKSAEYSINTTQDAKCNVVEIEHNEKALEDLKESLILSMDAKTFGLKRELECLNSYYQYVAAGLSVCSLLLGGGIGLITQLALQKMKTLKPSVVLPITVLYHCVGYAIGGLCFQNTMDLYLQRRNLAITKDLADSGYANGGIEYFEKLIKKNIALRTLLGPKGEQLYTEDGNVIYSKERNPNVPLTQQKETLAASLSNG